MLSLVDAHAAFTYEPDTGIIRWKIYAGRNGGRAQPGKVAGCSNGISGYVSIRYNKKLYKAHRIAWLLYYGTDVPPLIDHINGNKSDNRISNLRAANKSENTTNSKAHKDNKLGYKNISEKDGGYIVQIMKNGSRLYKWFDASSLHAAIAYRDAQLRLMHGEFTTT